MQFHKGGFHPGRWVAVLLAIALAFAAPPLRAAGLEEALAHFATDDYSEIEAGITAAVGKGGSPAGLILQGLREDRPLFSAHQGRAVYQGSSGRPLGASAPLQGLPAETPDAVAAAAKRAIAAMGSELALWELVQNAWYGLSLGSVLLLAAIGLAITFGVMGVINMAHGEMVMIGAYVTFVIQEYIRTSNPGLFDYSLLIAVPLAFLVAGALGILNEHRIIRLLYGQPLDTLLPT